MSNLTGKLTGTYRKLIIAACKANFGLSDDNIDYTRVLNKCRNSSMAAMGKIKRLNFDMRRNKDCITTYMLSQIYLQDMFNLAPDEVLIMNDLYPKKRYVRVQDWLITETEESFILDIIESVNIEPGLVVKHYPDGVKQYQIIPLELLESEYATGFKSGIIEIQDRPMIKSLA
jgi:hypothetical protein